MMGQVLTPKVSRDAVVKLGAVEVVLASLQFLRPVTHQRHSGNLHTVWCAFDFLRRFLKDQKGEYYHQLVARTGAVQLAVNALKLIHQRDQERAEQVNLLTDSALRQQLLDFLV